MAKNEQDELDQIREWINSIPALPDDALIRVLATTRQLPPELAGFAKRIIHQKIMVDAQLAALLFTEEA